MFQNFGLINSQPHPQSSLGKFLVVSMPMMQYLYPLSQRLLRRGFMVRFCSSSSSSSSSSHENETIISSSPALPPVTKLVSEFFVKPKHKVHLVSKQHQIIYLGPFDLIMLSGHYIQKGLLFPKPHNINIQAFIDSLKDSLSLTLTHFYPLAGQLATQREKHSSLIFLDCNKGPGARFSHATIGLTVADILSPKYVPRVVHSFFDQDEDTVNHDGHFRPLLSVQVTELVDGVFVGCSINHVVADGISYWHFFNSWSEIHMKNKAAPAAAAAYNDNNNNPIMISRPPIHERWLPDGYDPIIKLPFTHPDEFVSRYQAPELLRERIFHFSSESIAELKARANAELCGTKNTIKMISSFQALAALAWRCITRARSPPQDQETTCKLTVDNRRRLEPPLSQDYFGSFIQTVEAVTLAGELIEGNIGSAAMLLNKAVAEHNDKTVRYSIKRWMETHFIYKVGGYFDPFSVLIGGSSRFDVYGNEFGLGKAVAVLSGYGDKTDGKMVPYPACEGEGSVDLEISLSPASMTALESDREFMDAVVTSSS
ncbi:hypothetical protein Dimus_004528 [Dionaea muscipula]